MCVRERESERAAVHIYVCIDVGECGKGERKKTERERYYESVRENERALSL